LEGVHGLFLHYGAQDKRYSLAIQPVVPGLRIEETWFFRSLICMDIFEVYAAAALNKASASNKPKRAA